MDMLFDDQIAALRPADWRKLAQGLHARYLVDDLAATARFLAAVADADPGVGEHLSVSAGRGYVDLKLVSADAVYRADDQELTVEWVTQADVDLAHRISAVAADHGLAPDPAAVSVVELGLDTTQSPVVAPVWAALLTGDPTSQGRGSPSDEIRDASGRVPNLWFGELEGDEEPPAQRLHLEVYVAPEAAEQRVSAAVAAGGTVVDSSDSPSLTVVADQDGNTVALCVAEPPTQG
mgnify:CR=1 FL=1